MLLKLANTSVRFIHIDVPLSVISAHGALAKMDSLDALTSFIAGKLLAGESGKAGGITYRCFGMPYTVESLVVEGTLASNAAVNLSFTKDSDLSSLSYPVLNGTATLCQSVVASIIKAKCEKLSVALNAKRDGMGLTTAMNFQLNEMQDRIDELLSLPIYMARSAERIFKVTANYLYALGTAPTISGISNYTAVAATATEMSGAIEAMKNKVSGDFTSMTGLNASELWTKIAQYGVLDWFNGSQNCVKIERNRPVVWKKNSVIASLLDNRSVVHAASDLIKFRYFNPSDDGVDGAVKSAIESVTSGSSQSTIASVATTMGVSSRARELAELEVLHIIGEISFDVIGSNTSGNDDVYIGSKSTFPTRYLTTVMTPVIGAPQFVTDGVTVEVRISGSVEGYSATDIARVIGTSTSVDRASALNVVCALQVASAVCYAASHSSYAEAVSKYKAGELSARFALNESGLDYLSHNTAKYRARRLT
jgi:hypothetical protein